MEKGHGRRRNSFILKLLVLMGIAVGCQRTENYKGYAISNEIRAEIWKIEADFCTSIMKKENLVAYDLMSDSMAAKFDKNKLDSQFYPIGRNLMDYEFFAQNIYLQKATSDKPLVKVRFDDEEIKPYEIRFISNAKVAALTTAILGDGDIQSCMLMLFGQNSNKWEIENVMINLLKIEGKDANDWLNEAEKWIEKKDYAMACYCNRMCDWLIKPGSVFWYYDNEAEMLDKMEKIDRKIQRNLKPPHQIEEIETKPDIQSIQAFMWNKKVYPGIVYNTKLPLNDSLAIEKECSKLDVVFATYFKNWERDTIFVEIVHQEDLWTKPTINIMKKRKLDKGLLSN